VGLLMDEKNRYLFAEPGMHNIASCFTKVERKPENLRSVVVHGNRTIVVVEQGAYGARSASHNSWSVSKICSSRSGQILP